MNFSEKILGKLFKANVAAQIDFHANGFFVRKEVSYVAFFQNKGVIIYNRIEGLNPHDTDIKKVLDQMLTKENADTMEALTQGDNSNVLKFRHKGTYYMCVPSIFLQNLVEEPLTEIALKNQSTDEVLIYQLLYEI